MKYDGDLDAMQEVFSLNEDRQHEDTYTQQDVDNKNNLDGVKSVYQNKEK